MRWCHTTTRLTINVSSITNWGYHLKRALVIALAGVLTFGAVYGFAASLNLTTDSLGAADTAVAACQAGQLTATYTSTYSATVPGYAVGTLGAFWTIQRVTMMLAGK